MKENFMITIMFICSWIKLLVFISFHDINKLFVLKYKLNIITTEKRLSLSESTGHHLISNKQMSKE